MSFSKLNGYETRPEALDDLTPRTRTKLFNVVDETYWIEIKWLANSGPLVDAFRTLNATIVSPNTPLRQTDAYSFIRKFWSDQGLRVDCIQTTLQEVKDEIYLQFLNAPWHTVFDFIEIFSTQFSTGNLLNNFHLLINNALRSEGSQYNLVVGRIVKLTNEETNETIKFSATLPEPYHNCSRHIEAALTALSQRNKPDYRNSIKESISALESLSKSLTGMKNGTLGEILKKLRQEKLIHPAMCTAFSNLYGYTSDSGGIRHALRDDDIEPGFIEARFMLVACSAAIEFIIAKNNQRMENESKSP